MSSNRKFHLTFAALVLVLASVSYWVIGGQSSPYADYFSTSLILTLWRGLNLIPFFAGVMAGGHAGNDLVFFTAFAIQWFLVGWVLSLIVLRFKSKPAESMHIFKG
jgi:hypothetical protein